VRVRERGGEGVLLVKGRRTAYAGERWLKAEKSGNGRRTEEESCLGKGKGQGLQVEGDLGGGRGGEEA
jgi:hypothetical protein